MKRILDACCGSRMMWFDKENPDAIFADIREESHILCDGRELHVKPDVICDFKDMPFEENTFYVVVMDFPHLVKVGAKSWLFKKYGSLSETWQEDLRLGVNEGMRVLKPNGTLVVKWNEQQVKVKQLLEAIDHKPLFGHPTGRHGKTHWLLFIKNSN